MLDSTSNANGSPHLAGRQRQQGVWLHTRACQMVGELVVMACQRLHTKGVTCISRKVDQSDALQDAARRA